MQGVGSPVEVVDDIRVPEERVNRFGRLIRCPEQETVLYPDKLLWHQHAHHAAPEWLHSATVTVLVGRDTL